MHFSLNAIEETMALLINFDMHVPTNEYNKEASQINKLVKVEKEIKRKQLMKSKKDQALSSLSVIADGRSTAQKMMQPKFKSMNHLNSEFHSRGREMNLI